MGRGGILEGAGSTLPALQLLLITESGGVGTPQAPNTMADGLVGQDSALLCCSRPWSPGGPICPPASDISQGRLSPKQREGYAGARR